MTSGRPASRAARLLFSICYTLLWCVAGPWLFLSRRLRQGWRQRLGFGRTAPCDVWIQGASAGECTLIEGLLPELRGARVLATTCTAQGLEVLGKMSAPDFEMRLLPFDLPALMERMLRQARPRVVVLLETEIWPGLLMACAKRNIPVVVANARMSTKSLAGYLFLRPLLGLCPPERIGAIATADARRFGLVFGAGRTSVTGNIKFDRAMNAPFIAPEALSLAGLVPAQDAFIALGSVREQEEPAVMELIRTLRATDPHCVVGLFPRHMHRIEAWEKLLAGAGIPWVRRTRLNDAAAPGAVVLWDKFGELHQAYALAHRAFVGGSLARLGGQNFLEPLAQGVLPCVGPSTRNFDWVGQEIFSDLVFRSADIAALAATLLSPAPPRAEVRRRALAYVQSRQGATAASAAMIKTHLS